MISPLKIVVVNPQGSAYVSFDITIMRQGMELDEYTDIILAALANGRLDFKETASTQVSPHGIQAQETVFEYTDSFSTGSQTWKAKLLTGISGELGFIASSEAQELLFERHEPTLDAIVNSLTMPGPEFAPPAPSVTNATIATDIDEFAQIPIGSGTNFAAGTTRLYTYIVLHNVPFDSTVEFVWAEVDSQNNRVRVSDRTSGKIAGTVPIWAWTDDENSLPSGRFESQVLINGELISAIPFTVEPHEFANERLGMAFSYPSGWAIDQSDPTLIKLDPGPGLLVQVASVLAGPKTLDAAVSDTVKGLESLGMRELSRTALEHKVPSRLIRFEWSINDTPFLFDTAISVIGSRAFFINLFRPSRAENDRLKADFEQVLSSFDPEITPTFELVDESAEIDEIINAIQGRVASIRGLPDQPEVESRFEDRQEFKSETEADLSHGESKQSGGTLKDFCLVFDLCAESDDLLKESNDLAGEGVIGYYSPANKTLTVIQDADTFRAQDWLTYAHEYTHALQDEHFDTFSLELEDGDIESSKAIGALIEGDAKLVEFLFYDSLPIELQIDLSISHDEAVEEFSESPELTEAPRIISETFGWEHVKGADFVYRLYLDGGFDAVDRAYENPPQSTEQILHFEKYISGEAPLAVSLPDLASGLGDEWNESNAGVLGELLTGIYLGTFVPEDVADSAAQGWGGDSYVILKDNQGRRLMAMLHSWDSEADAVEFFEAYLKFAAIKSEGLWDLRATEDNERLWLGQDISVYLAVHRSETLVVIGPDGDTVEATVSQFSSFD